MSRIGWLDCSSGVSGDMLLGALESLGALTQMPRLLASLSDLDVGGAAVPTTRNGVAATSYQVTAGAEQPDRRLTDVLDVIGRADVSGQVRDQASAIFQRLAEVEATVHGSSLADVQFHEIGAVDAIVDVLGACLGLETLGLDELVVSPIALGGGAVQSAHGWLPVPAPAVLGLLTGSALEGYGGPVDVELATPTGVAIVTQWVGRSGPMPTMTVDRVGVGAGGRDLEGRANVVRLVVGDAVGDGSVTTSAWSVLEANVDDLDPRLWPGVLERLIAAGAADAWLTPILMKKGRPAHTVSVLVDTGAAAAVRDVLVSETSTIGLRATAISKDALERSWVTVDVGGQPVRVKLSHDSGRRTNLAPEFDDVAAAAAALGVPVKDVLVRAAAAALRTAD
jgi:uncharacterized protein (TIGR00299 family) protein